MTPTWNHNLVTLAPGLEIPRIFRRPGEGQRPRSMTFSVVHSLAISRDRRIAFFPRSELLRGCTQCSLFAWVDYDAKRISATGATISMQMSRRATNTKPARVAVLLERMANKENERGRKREGEKSSTNVFIFVRGKFGKIRQGKYTTERLLSERYTFFSFPFFSSFDTRQRVCFQKKYVLLWNIFLKKQKYLWTSCHVSNKNIGN